MQSATDGNRILAFDAHSPAVRPPLVVESTTAPQTSPPRWRTVAPVLFVVACVAAGFALRGFCYARNQSLWIDEAMLALNVVYRTPAELLRPLDLNQGAPVGYLLLSKYVVKAFGPGELALRLVSLVASVAGLAVFVPLAYRMLPAAAARLAVCLFALAPYLVGYSAEFKQYELDATLAVVLMAVGLPVWRNEAGRGRLVAFAAAGAVAVWFSHPAVFVLGGVGLAALADAAARRDRAALLARLGVVAAWLASFAVCFLLFTRKLGMNQYLLDYWAGTFMPLPPTGVGDLAWVVHHFLALFEKPGGLNPTEFGAGGLAAACYLVGALALARTDWRTLVALVAPLVLALAASGLHKYPFAGRLMMFAVPALLLVVGYGATVAAGGLNRTLPGAGLVVLALLFVAPVAECRWLLKKPSHAEDARAAVAYVHEHWQAGDRLYVYYGAVPAFAYYSPRYPFPPEAVRFGVENRRGDQRVFQEELQPLRGKRRVWVIFAHRQSAEEAAVQAYLDSAGRREDQTRWNDAAVMRYDLVAPLAPPDGSVRGDAKPPQ